VYQTCDEEEPDVFDCVTHMPDLCIYTNPYYSAIACREYPEGVAIGAPVPGETPEQNCLDHNPVSDTVGDPGTFSENALCGDVDVVGRCLTGGVYDYMYGASGATCENCDPAVNGNQAWACELVGGTFDCWLSGC
jgi:hypothetical protein